MADPFRIRVSSAVADDLRRLHPGLKRKVRAALDFIREDPSCGKALGEDLAGFRSFRVGRFRIVYRAGERRVIDLIAVGPRRTIYEETARLLRRR